MILYLAVPSPDIDKASRMMKTLIESSKSFDIKLSWVCNEM